jgi:flagellar biosynthesis protein FlhA
MLERLKKETPAVVEGLVPEQLTLGEVQEVLRSLLRERVPIRDLVTILESLADVAETTKDPEILAEHVRRALGKAIVEQHMDQTGTVHGIVLSPRLEAALMGFFSPRQGKASALPGPEQLTELMRRLDHLVRLHARDGRPVVLVTPPTLRVGVRRLLEPVLPAVPVISLAELPPQVTLDTIAVWDWNDAN